MKGLELLKKAFALQPVERVPWVPFVDALTQPAEGLGKEAGG